MCCQGCARHALIAPRHSYTTRLLTTLLPSNWYAKKDASINAILQALAHDLTQLLDVGITVEAGW